VAAVEFGPVDGMPWKQAMPSRNVANFMRQLPVDLKIEFQDFGPNIKDAIVWCANHDKVTKPIVIVGSLYLVSDVLRMHLDASLSSKQPTTTLPVQQDCRTIRLS